MFDKLQTLMDELANIFSDVSMSDDKVLTKADTVSIFVDSLDLEYLTFQKIQYTGTLSMIFSLSGEGLAVYQAADSRIDDINVVMNGVFDSYQLKNIQFQYVKQQNRLFVYAKWIIKWR